MSQGNPRSGEFYKNTTGELLQVLTVARHSVTGEPLVICQILSGTFARYAIPYDVFVARADQRKYPNIAWNYTLCQMEGERSEEAPRVKQAADTSSEAHADTNSSAENASPSEDDLAGVNRNLLAFLDADDVQEKYEILNNMSMDEIDDQLIDTMAVSLDVVIPEGPVDMRLMQLKNILKTRGQYEQKRFR